MRANTFI